MVLENRGEALTAVVATLAVSVAAGGVLSASRKMSGSTEEKPKGFEEALAKAKTIIGEKQSVCVFLGSSKGNGDEYASAARRLGRLLAEKDVALVYGGGNVGLMGALSSACVQAGGRVVGVIPRALAQKELAGVSSGGVFEVVVETMHERKAAMASLASAFIAMPGGYGTLEEALEAATWTQIGMHSKSVGLLNVNGFWNNFVTFLEHIMGEGFITQERLGIFLVDDKEDALLERVLSHTPPEGYTSSEAWAPK
jgi:uncharacterized protein (TIGR00730 family)